MVGRGFPNQVTCCPLRPSTDMAFNQQKHIYRTNQVTEQSLRSDRLADTARYCRGQFAGRCPALRRRQHCQLPEQVFTSPSLSFYKQGITFSSIQFVVITVFCQKSPPPPASSYFCLLLYSRLGCSEYILSQFSSHSCMSGSDLQSLNMLYSWKACSFISKSTTMIFRCRCSLFKVAFQLNVRRISLDFTICIGVLADCISPLEHSFTRIMAIQGRKIPRECKSQVNSIKNSSIAMEGVELKCDALRHSQFVPSVVGAGLDISTGGRTVF